MRSVLVDARLPWGSGIGRYVDNTVPLVAAAMPSIKFQLLVSPETTARAGDMAASLPNVTVKESDLAPFSPGEQWRLAGLMRPHDLTWFTNYWVPLAFRGRFVAAVHDVLHLERELFPAHWAKRALSRRTFAHVAAHAQGVLYGSRFTQREFQRRFGAPRRAVVSGYGIDHRGWRLFDPLHPPAKQRRLLLVAAAKRHKNFRIAIEAFRRATIDAGWTLTLIVPADRLRSSVDVDAMARADDRVELRQGVSNEELRACYTQAAIVLMPSLYEGFGLPLAEGLQAGAQCIASASAALVELAQGARVTFVNGEDLTGWVQAIEAECASFDARTVRREQVTANMAHAGRFTWAAVADATVTMLDAVLNDRMSLIQAERHT